MGAASQHSRCHRCSHQLRLLSNIAFFLGFVPMAASQSITTSPSASSLPSASSHLPSSLTTLSTAASGEASFALIPSSTNSTASGPIPTDDAPLTTPLSSSPPTSQDDDDGLLNYYFFFLALLVILLLLGIWYIHRRKKQRKAQLRNSGQNALARDLNGWSQPRRWMHGVAPWRTEGVEVGRDEGLNELGEAPPAYSKDMGSSERRVSGSSTLVGGADPLLQPAIPLRTVSRDGRDRLRIRPPGYEESIHGSLTPTSIPSRPGSALPSPLTEHVPQLHQ